MMIGKDFDQIAAEARSELRRARRNFLLACSTVVRSQRSESKAADSSQVLEACRADIHRLLSEDSLFQDTDACIHDDFFRDWLMLQQCITRKLRVVIGYRFTRIFAQLFRL